jgi:3-oxoacyl-[acyl-carrier-protein] synthase-3
MVPPITTTRCPSSPEVLLAGMVNPRARRHPSLKATERRLSEACVALKPAGALARRKSRFSAIADYRPGNLPPGEPAPGELHRAIERGPWVDTNEVRVLSAGTALPGQPVDNAALARRFGMDELWQQWVDVFIGTGTRYLCKDLASGVASETLADLAARAGRQAIASAGLSADDIDVLVMSTATPDALMPATVNMAAEQLGLNGLPTYQLQTGCAGAIQALDVARGMLLTGERRTALVIGGDVCTKHFDLELDLAKLSPAELVNIVLFGDGAGAAVLTTEPVPGSVVLRRVLNRLTGTGRPPGHTLEWFGLADRASAQPAASEDYKAIEESVPVMSAEILAELLDDLDWKDDDVDFLLPPQLSGRMTALIVERLGLPHADEISVVAETGNNGNALPFLQLERVLGRMTTGDRAVAVAVESSKWLKAGFALEKS